MQDHLQNFGQGGSNSVSEDQLYLNNHSWAKPIYGRSEFLHMSSQLESIHILAFHYNRSWSMFWQNQQKIQLDSLKILITSLSNDYKKMMTNGGLPRNSYFILFSQVQINTD